jgi:hypothetical protein
VQCDATSSYSNSCGSEVSDLKSSGAAARQTFYFERSLRSARSQCNQDKLSLHAPQPHQRPPGLLFAQLSKPISTIMFQRDGTILSELKVDAEKTLKIHYEQ